MGFCIMKRVKGSALKVGDTIEVWWAPNRDTITGLRKYDGPLAHLFPDGAKLADFALLKTGMTIDNGNFYNRIS
jgi:hypothetical protein